MLPLWIGISALLLASLIAFSRLYLGAHYPLMCCVACCWEFCSHSSHKFWFTFCWITAHGCRRQSAFGFRKRKSKKPKWKKVYSARFPLCAVHLFESKFSRISPGFPDLSAKVQHRHHWASANRHGATASRCRLSVHPAGSFS